jgi:hypothetical protein
LAKSRIGFRTELITRFYEFLLDGGVGSSSSATEFLKAEENLTYKLESRGLVLGTLSKFRSTFLLG